jgi:hypothetical protein
MRLESSGCGGVEGHAKWVGASSPARRSDDPPNPLAPCPTLREARSQRAADRGRDREQQPQPVSSPARSILPVVALLLLTACASDPQVIHQRIYVRQEIPQSLLTCAPWPQPDSLPSDVRGLVEWLARAKAAHMDCAWRLESVRGLVE